MTITFENPLQMLRLLKGCPLSVLLALKISQKLNDSPSGAEWIERATGYTDKPVAQALGLLEDYGMVIRSGRYGWQLTPAALGLPLAVLGLEERTDAPQSPMDRDEVDEAADCQPEQNSGLGIKSTRGKTESEKVLPSVPLVSRMVNLDSNLKELNSRSESSPRTGEPEKCRAKSPADDAAYAPAGHFRTSQLDEGSSGADSAEAGRAERVLAELDRQGIREPARTRLAKLPRITAELVRYHCATSDNPGHAIHRLEHGWPVDPRKWQQFFPEKTYVVPEGSDPEPGLPAAETESGPADGPEPAALAAWESALRSVEPEFKRGDYLNWIWKGVWLVSEQADQYRVGTANSSGLAVLERTGAAAIFARHLSQLTGRPAEVRFEVCERIE